MKYVKEISVHDFVQFFSLKIIEKLEVNNNVTSQNCFSYTKLILDSLDDIYYTRRIFKKKVEIYRKKLPFIYAFQTFFFNFDFFLLQILKMNKINAKVIMIQAIFQKI